MPPRRVKGLLGVPKDPRNQILFSFKARVGEEWPSDEDDSDYSPGYHSDSDNTPGPSQTKSKEAQKKTAQSKKLTKKSVKSANEKSKTKATKRPRMKEEEDPIVSATLGKMARTSTPVKTIAYSGHLPALPPEIWEKIFTYVVRDDGALPFLDRAEKVCPLWREVSARPHLWEIVDFGKAVGYGWKIKDTKAGFTRLCKQRLGSCRYLGLPNCGFMGSPWAIQAIVDHCPELRAINLSYCRRLPAGSLNKLVENCRHLEDIDVSYTTDDCISSQTIKNVCQKCGSNLKRLVLSHNMTKSFMSYIKSLTAYCPNLQHLDVSNMKLSTDSITLDIEDAQRHFPRLKTLCISNTPVRATTASRAQQEQGLGFPELEELSLASINANFVTLDFITRMLKNSPKLRLLDIRGCVAPRVIDNLLDLVTPNLEQLFLARSGALSCFELKDIIRKWRHSLTHLDLSWMTFKDTILEDTLYELASADHPNTAIVHLDFIGTNLNMASLRSLLAAVPNLAHLDLSSCRDLDRGHKRLYFRQSDVQSLRQSLDVG